MPEIESVDARIERASHALRQLRDAMLSITNAGPDMPTSAIRAVAALAVRVADDTLLELTR